MWLDKLLTRQRKYENTAFQGFVKDLRDPVEQVPSREAIANPFSIVCSACVGGQIEELQLIR
jgi:hypothetical protein